MFASGMSPAEVAARLEVSAKSARAWRRAWATGGEAALASKGSSGPPPRLTAPQLRQLERLLEAGPAAAGFTEDQRWTLARVAQVIATTFRVRYSLKGVSLVSRRFGWTRRCRCTGPPNAMRTPSPHGGDAVAGGKRVARRLGAWICFADEAGHTLRPAKARTWSPRGHTPVVQVTGKGSGRISIAGLVCYKPGIRSRLIYRMMLHRGRKGEPKGFRENNFAALLVAAHQQLGGPIVLVWDNLHGHRFAAMRALIAARPWLRVYQLPGYAPELNPAEGIWSHLKRSLANLAEQNITNLARLVKTRLKRMQYVPGLIDGFLAGTGLSPP
jgi:putative transposase